MELTESQANFVVALTIAIFVWIIYLVSFEHNKRANVHTIIAGLKPYYPCQLTSSSYSGHSYDIPRNMQPSVVEITIQGPPKLRILYLCPDLKPGLGIDFAQTRFVAEIKTSQPKSETELIRLFSEGGVHIASNNIVYINEKSPRGLQIIFPGIISDIPKLKQILDIISKINQ